jgi:hypothetical protein
MLDVAKNILDVVKSLLGLSEQLKGAERQRRADMADLFEKISDCLAATSGEIRAGGVPYGRCSMLITYAQTLPGVIDREIGRERAKELGDMLYSAYDVEGLAIRIASSLDREGYLAQIEEASGKFRALADLIRVGL